MLIQEAQAATGAIPGDSGVVRLALPADAAFDRTLAWKDQAMDWEILRAGRTLHVWGYPRGARQ